MDGRTCLEDDEASCFLLQPAVSVFCRVMMRFVEVNVLLSVVPSPFFMPVEIIIPFCVSDPSWSLWSVLVCHVAP